ncbi:MAG TPA: DUF47 family protein [Thermoprotei archaeon]|nr:DUF47 family protein [Thermoprotei archaeon]
MGSVMYRDSELEARRQIISYLQDLSRMAVEITGLLVKVIDGVISSSQEELIELYMRIKEVDNSVANLQKTIMSEIIKLRPFLPNSVAIYELVAKVGDVVDEIDGAAYRLVYLNLSTLNRWELDLLYKIAETLFKEVDAFREAIYLMGYNPTALREAIERIFELEMEVDKVHRAALSEVFRKESKARNIIKWLEISERLESAADTVERVADILVTFLIG